MQQYADHKRLNVSPPNMEDISYRQTVAFRIIDVAIADVLAQDRARKEPPQPQQSGATPQGRPVARSTAMSRMKKGLASASRIHRTSRRR